MKSLKFLMILAVAVSALSAAHAQTWPYPANQAGATAPCTGCGGTIEGLPTFPWSDPIVGYTGRFLDSTTTHDWQGPYRTGRANYTVYSPTNNRIYMAIGSGVGAYDASTLFTRLQAREALWTIGGHPPPVEVWLKWDKWFYAELSGWKTYIADGQDRLKGLDFDDRGNVYLAYSIFGWGIVKDNGGHDSALMTSLSQQPGVSGPSVSAVISLKNSAGAYFALVKGDKGVVLWNVNDPAKPKVVATVPVAFSSYAKTDDRIALLFPSSNGTLTGSIYTIDALTSGGSPLFTLTPTGYFAGVTTDGTNFYLSGGSAAGFTITTVAPTSSAKTAYVQRDFQPLGRSAVTPMSVNYGSGYLAIAAVGGTGGNGQDVLLYRVNGTQFTEVPFNNYFNKYYVTAPTGYAAPRAFFSCVQPYKAGSKLYLLLSGFYLGDVYEIRSDESLSVTVKGDVGTMNGGAPTRAAGTLFYGDKVRFSAVSGATAPKTIAWNFGNPESGVDNSPTALSNQDIDHQYSGLTATTLATGPRTVTATDTASSTVAQASVPLLAPTARVGVTNGSTTYKYLLAQPNASAPVPIVAGDSFFDGSDGDLEGHYAEWNIDGTVSKTVPYSGTLSGYQVPTGACGDHTLTYTAHYGPYSNFVTAGGVDFPVSIGSVSYKVRPFTAVINPNRTTSSGNLVFTSDSRFSTEASIVSPVNVTWSWDVVDTNDQPIASTATLSGTGTTVQAFSAPKTSFSQRGARVRLTITSPALTGACAGLESSKAYTAALNGPDPAVSGGCSSGAPPCTFTVASLSGTNMTNDHWHFAWTVSGGTVTASTDTPTWTPSFTSTGDFTVGVTVSNDIGQAPAVTGLAHVTTPASVCATMTGSNVWMAYNDAAYKCSPSGGTCPVGQPVSFYVQTAGYSFSCADHTFTWNFGDGNTANTSEATHTYSNAGTYTVTLTVSNPSQTFIMTKSLTVGGSTTPPPTGCGTMNSSNLYIVYHNSGFTCPSGVQQCGTNEVLTFAPQEQGYSLSCATHSFLWNFGDGSTSNQQSASHTYTNPGTYTVSLTVANTTQNYQTSASVPITNGTTQPPITGSCATMTNNNVWMAYNDLAFTCSLSGGSCPANQPLTFYAQTQGYSFSCAAHTYTWNFGDGSAPTTSQDSWQTSHTYASAGSYTATLTISNSTQTFVMSKVISVGGGTPPGSCPTITADKMYIVYSNAAGDCLLSNNTGCKTNNAVNFTAQLVGYSLSCGTHTFGWNFGDGTTGTGQTAAHAYTTGGNYTVTLTVTNAQQVYTTTAPIAVASDSPAQPAPEVTVLVEQLLFNQFRFTPTVKSGTVTKFSWDFGDGTTAETTIAKAVTNTYSTTGQYTVTLTASQASASDPSAIWSKVVKVLLTRLRGVRH
jgi:PKD repeat protein